MLSGYDLAALGEGSADALHVIAEAQKLAWADRNKFVADPGFVPVPTAGLIDPAYAAQRRSLIDMAHAGDPKAGQPPDGAPSTRSLRPSETPNPRVHHPRVDHRRRRQRDRAHVHDRAGVRQRGRRARRRFLLNNELTDFGAAGTANEARPGKRPRSSMAPTIVVRGARPELVVGGAGGAHIIMGVGWTILNRIDFGQDIAHAVDSERTDSQTKSKLTIEEGRVFSDVLADLQSRGHKLDAAGEYDDTPRVQAAGIDPNTGLRTAVSDSRTDRAALVQRRRP